jgi:hypothetical protein
MLPKHLHYCQNDPHISRQVTTTTVQEQTTATYLLLLYRLNYKLFVIGSYFRTTREKIVFNYILSQDVNFLLYCIDVFSK